MDKENLICLSKLYKSVVLRNAIWKFLSEIFESNFERLANNVSQQNKHIVKIAQTYKDPIKELVIEYGYELQTWSDLLKCLDELKIWDEVDTPANTLCQFNCIERVTDKSD